MEINSFTASSLHRLVGTRIYHRYSNLRPDIQVIALTMQIVKLLGSIISSLIEGSLFALISSHGF